MRKRIKNGLYIAFMFLLSELMLSCIKEANPLDEKAGSTTDVMLTVSRGIGSGNASDSKEGIKKMRVIVASVAADGTETLLRNEVFYDNVNTNAQTYTVSMDNLQRGLTKFYVVCNEGSLPAGVQTYLSEELTEGVSIEGLATYVVEDYNRNSFPQLRINIGDNVGIPITGISQTVDLQKKNETVSFGIQYMVAKITVNVTNNTSTGITVDSFGMSTFLADKAYLFPQTSGSVVPKDVGYSYKTIDISDTWITSGTKVEGVMNLYVYPSEAGTDNYKIGMTRTDGQSYNPITFFRGTALDRGVYAELNGIFGTNPTPEFSYTVNEWGNGGTNNVPAFD